RDRIGLGVKLTSETTSRCGALTLVTGIEVLPSASLIWPAGPGGGGGGGEVAGRTIAVRADSALADPALFVARTSKRRRWLTSALTRRYVFAVAPAMSVQLPGWFVQRRHWYANVIGCVPPHSPSRAVSVA